MEIALAETGDTAEWRLVCSRGKERAQMRSFYCCLSGVENRALFKSCWMHYLIWCPFLEKQLWFLLSLTSTQRRDWLHPCFLERQLLLQYWNHWLACPEAHPWPGEQKWSLAPEALYAMGAALILVTQVFSTSSINLSCSVLEQILFCVQQQLLFFSTRSFLGNKPANKREFPLYAYNNISASAANKKPRDCSNHKQNLDLDADVQLFSKHLLVHNPVRMVSSGSVFNNPSLSAALCKKLSS